MKKTNIIFVFMAIVGIAAIIISCNTDSNDVAANPPHDPVEHGAYLVQTMGCNDCHSPKIFGPMGPMPDTSRLLSGHPSDILPGSIDTNVLKHWVLFGHMTTIAAGPWGVSFSANITSDSTGIGTWTFEQFKTAMTKGKSRGLENNRPLMPPMPWQNYVNIHEEDLKDIFAYLKSTNPVHNVVPAWIAPGTAK